MTEYQIVPVLANGNRRCWQLQCKSDASTWWNVIAVTTSIKAAKTIAAHMRRKAIKL